ncbi:MAG: hypothetical protein II928_03895 [Paludibacteraceae bacterium]|nr:hypothetical protein [Paludibacteraceae bacterium]
MKNFISVIVSVLLSILIVWLLLPSMERYYSQKKDAPQEVVEEAEKAKEPMKEEVNKEDAISAEVLKTDWKIIYTLRNNTADPIKNIKLRFIYFDKNGKQIHYRDETLGYTLEPGLTQSFDCYCPSEVEGKYNLEIKVLEYNLKSAW